MTKAKGRSRGGGSTRGGGAGVPLAPRLGLFLLRVFTGAFFLDAIQYKLLSAEYAGGGSIADNFAFFRDHEYPGLLQAAIASPPDVLGVKLDAYAAFLRDVMLPNADVFAPLILAFELLLGVSLVLGLGVRLSAFLGFLLMVCFSLAKGLYLLTVRSANWPVTLILLALSLLGAGRVWGLDARFAGRWPRWVS